MIITITDSRTHRFLLMILSCDLLLPPFPTMWFSHTVHTPPTHKSSAGGGGGWDQLSRGQWDQHKSQLFKHGLRHLSHSISRYSLESALQSLILWPTNNIMFSFPESVTRLVIRSIWAPACWQRHNQNITGENQFYAESFRKHLITVLMPHFGI